MTTEDNKLVPDKVLPWQQRFPFKYLTDIELKNSDELYMMVKREHWFRVEDLAIWTPKEPDAELLMYLKLALVQRLNQKLSELTHKQQ